MRFILNFFLFGILFYLIYLFLPDTFYILVSWANKIIEFLKDLFIQLSANYHNWLGEPTGTGIPHQTIFLLEFLKR